MEWKYRGLDIGSGGQLDRDCPLHSSKVLFRRFYFAMRAIRVELLEEFLVYNYTPEYVTTHLLEKFSENKMRLLKEYFILYIQLPLAIGYLKDQGLECRGRQLTKC